VIVRTELTDRVTKHPIVNMENGTKPYPDPQRLGIENLQEILRAQTLKHA